MAEQFDRLVYDTSVLTDGWGADFDTNCHFTNIQAAYEGFLIWRKLEQIVYTPVYGDYLYDETGLLRDVSTWESTKTIAFINYQISTEIWAPYREITEEICETEFTLAYENTNIYACYNLNLIQDDVVIEEFRVINPTNGADKEVIGWIYKPAIAGAHNKFPAVILVPDDRVPGSVEFGENNSITGEPDAMYWAKKGYIAIVFDPDFRGQSAIENNQVLTWVSYNRWEPTEEVRLDVDNGHLQQDGLHAVISHVSELPEVDRLNIGIISHGWGLALAAGALGRYPNDPPVKFLIDVEGQADRYDVSSDCSVSGTLTHLGHLDHHVCDNDAWWEEREPIGYIADIECRYIRIQYTVDHNQLTIDHAIELIDEATNGGVPFTRINGPENKENVTWAGGIAPITLPTNIPRYQMEEQILREQFAFPLLGTDREVVVTWDNFTSTTTVEVHDFVRLIGKLCRAVNLIPWSSYSTFIDAVRIRGFSNEFGLCPYSGDLEYLCDRRGYDVEIETIHQSTRHRLYNDINCLMLDTTNTIYSHIPVINFEDEWTLLDGTKRRFAKYNTNIRTFKPLRYHLRMAPPDALVNPHPLDDFAGVGSGDTGTERLIRFERGTLIYDRFELPVTSGQSFQSLTLDLSYARTNIVPPGDISFYLRPLDQASADYLPDLNLQFILLEGYKTPLVCYFNLKTSSTPDPIIDPNTLQINPNDTFTLPDTSAPDHDRWQIASGVPYIDNDRLRMSTENGDEIVRSRYMLIDNFDVTVDGEKGTTQNKSWWIHALRIRFPDNDDHWCYVGRGYISNTPYHIIRSRYNKGGANTNVMELSAASLSDFVDYRMIRTGSEIAFFYKEHGSLTWESLGTLEMYDTACLVELVMTRGNLNPVAEGYFDNLEVFPSDNIIYDYQLTTDEISVINMDRVDFEYPVDTYGWGMKQKFYFYSYNIEAPAGIYEYSMEFHVKMPTLFGESTYRETFGFNEWFNTINLKVNVR